MPISIRPYVLAIVSWITFWIPLSPASAAGDGRGVEITPVASLLFGASFEIDDFELGRLEIDLEESTDLGLLVDIPINRHFQVELVYLDQSMQAEVDFGLLFAPEPLGRANLETYQAGVLWQGASGQLKPYFVFTGGLSRLDFELPGTNSETGLSMSFGGGLKAFFTDHIGVRVDGRFFVFEVDSGASEFGRGCCGEQNDSLGAGLVSAGLIFAF